MAMFSSVGRPGGPAGVHRVAVPDDARELATLPRVDYADAFATDLDAQRASAERWAQTMLADAPLAMRVVLIAGWSSLGLVMRRGPGTVLGWSVQEVSPDVLLLGARSRVEPGLSAQLLFKRREHDLLMCTFVRFHSAGARVLWKGVEPVHVRVVPELLAHMRRRAAHALRG